MAKITFKRKRGKWPSKAQMRRDILLRVGVSLNKIGAEHLKHRRFFVSTWKGRPKFEKMVNRERGGVVLRVGIGGQEKNVNKYFWIVYGTEVRYATMTPDFIAKTSRRSLASGPGRGGLAYVSRSSPRPGIEARETEQEIRDQLGGIEKEMIRLEILKVLKKRW